MTGMTCFMARYALLRLTANTRSQSASDTSTTLPISAMPTLLSSTSMRPKAFRQAATMASTSPARDASAVNAAALPPSAAMMRTVSSAAAALRSTQNTRAPSRANVTAVALPLPQPGPIEPAPTTSAVFPLSRSIDFSPFSPLSLTHAHRRNIDADRMSENFRQGSATAIMAQPPFAGGAGIAQQHLRQGRALRLPLKPAVEQARVRRRLHAGAGALDPRLYQLQ